MKKTAVICEINPYHTGHQYIFSRAREESDLVIAVMSGNFTQRAIPAVFDKYTRASLLLTPDETGTPAADIVVELPFPWCASGTEAFAMGGVAVALGLVRMLSSAEASAETPTPFSVQEMPRHPPPTSAASWNWKRTTDEGREAPSSATVL